MSSLRNGSVLGSLIAVAIFTACMSERVTTAPDLSGQCSLPLQPNVPGSTVVIVKDFAFEPTAVTIKAGTSVTWLNCAEQDEPAHTTTADDGAWSSPLLLPGASFTQTYPQVGTFSYHCEPHPFMTGTIIVEP